jgi:hypothetical protein
MKTLVLKKQEIVELSGACQYSTECQKEATSIAYDRDRREVKFYCDDHADRVVKDSGPEYRECCPNCGCEFGVN